MSDWKTRGQAAYTSNSAPVANDWKSRGAAAANGGMTNASVNVDSTPTAANVDQAMPDYISWGDRAVAKNFANSPESAMAYYKKEHPDKEFALFKGEVVARSKGDAKWQQIDPDNTGTLGISSDLGYDLLDMGYDTAAGIGQGLATTAGFMAGAPTVVGAPVGAAAASAASGAALEGARQGLGKLAGIPQDISGGDMAFSGALSAVMPAMGGVNKSAMIQSLGKKYGFNALTNWTPQLEKQSQGYISKGIDYVGPRAVQVATGISPELQAAYKKYKPQVQAIFNNKNEKAFVEELGQKVIDTGKRESDRLGKTIGNEMRNADKKADMTVPMGILKKAIDDIESNPNANKMQGSYLDSLKKSYDDLFSLMVPKKPDMSKIPEAQQYYDNIANAAKQVEPVTPVNFTQNMNLPKSVNDLPEAQQIYTSIANASTPQPPTQAVNFGHNLKIPTNVSEAPQAQPIFNEINQALTPTAKANPVKFDIPKATQTFDSMGMPINDSQLSKLANDEINAHRAALQKEAEKLAASVNFKNEAEKSNFIKSKLAELTDIDDQLKMDAIHKARLDSGANKLAQTIDNNNQANNANIIKTGLDDLGNMQAGLDVANKHKTTLESEALRLAKANQAKAKAEQEAYIKAQIDKLGEIEKVNTQTHYGPLEDAETLFKVEQDSKNISKTLMGGGSNRTTADINMRNPINEVYHAANDSLEAATDGTSKIAKAAYKKHKAVQAELDVNFNSPQKTYNTINRLNKDSKWSLLDLLGNQQNAGKLNIEPEVDTLRALHSFYPRETSPFAAEAVKKVDTPLTHGLTVASGLAGFSLGNRMAGPWAAMPLSVATGGIARKLGKTLASEKAARGYMAAGEFLDKTKMFNRALAPSLYGSQIAPNPWFKPDDEK